MDSKPLFLLDELLVQGRDLYPQMSDLVPQGFIVDKSTRLAKNCQTFGQYTLGASCLTWAACWKLLVTLHSYQQESEAGARQVSLSAYGDGSAGMLPLYVSSHVDAYA